MTALSSALALPIDVLDWARARVLKAFGRSIAPLVRSRELRVCVLGTGSVTLAFLLTALAPLWLLALGPIVLGVAHAAADVRYLVTRPRLHTRVGFWALVVLPLVAVVAMIDVRYGLLATAGAALAARGSWARRALVLAVAGVAIAMSWRYRYEAALVIAHLHNLVAVGIWWGWRPRASSLHYVPLALFAIGAVAIMAGALDGLEWALSGDHEALELHLATLAPFDWPWAPRLVLLFAFAQSVHYAVWTRLIPEEDRARETPRPFAASLRAFRADSGTLVVAAVIVLSIAVTIWACFDLMAARQGYLRGVLWHGYLELAVLGWLFVEARPLRQNV